MITFSLWCTGLLKNSMRRCAQKVPLVKKWVNYMPRKGDYLEVVNFRILLLVSCISLTAALTNMKLGGEM